MLKKLFLLFLSILLSSVFNLSKAVYYEPNDDINVYIENLDESFIKISSYASTNPSDIPVNLFTDVYKDFSVLKTKLPQPNQYFRQVYEKCEITSKSLADSYSRTKLNTFNSQCFEPWKDISKDIFTKYAVSAKFEAYPKS
jgi:hypothetical protein